MLACMRPPYCAYCRELTNTATMVAFLDYHPLREGVIGHPHGLEWFCEKHVAAARKYRHLPLDEALKKIDRAQRRWWWPFG